MSVKTVAEFLFGLIYFLGKNIAELGTWLLASSWGAIVQTYGLLEILFYTLLEAEKSAIRGLFLIYYGTGQILEAFHTTTLDLINYVHNTTTTIGQILSSTFNGLLSSICAISFIPRQLIDALTIIGETCSIYFQLTLNLTWSLLSQVILSPIRVLQYTCHFLRVLLTSQWSFLISIPPSALIGLGVVLLCYFMYCRLNFVLFVRSLWAGLKRILSILFTIICGILSIILFFRRRSVQGGGHGVEQINPFVGGHAKNGSKGLCVICQDSQVAFISSPCNHVSLCTECVHQIVERDDKCPICRVHVEHYARVYIP